MPGSALTLFSSIQLKLNSGGLHNSPSRSISLAGNAEGNGLAQCPGNCSLASRVLPQNDLKVLNAWMSGKTGADLVCSKVDVARMEDNIVIGVCHSLAEDHLRSETCSPSHLLMQVVSLC